MLLLCNRNIFLSQIIALLFSDICIPGNEYTQFKTKSKYMNSPEHLNAKLN